MKRVQKAFKHHDAVMVQMPTGTGKTMVLANIVFSFLEKCNNPIWIVAHRRELVSQIKDTLNKSLLIFSNHPVPLSKEGSTSTPCPSSSEGGDVTALRCSEPLRSKVGGPSKVSPDCTGWDRMGMTGYSLYPGNLLITCRFLVVFLMVSRKKRNFGGKLYKLNNNVIFRNGLMIMTRMDWNIDL